MPKAKNYNDWYGIGLNLYLVSPTMASYRLFVEYSLVSRVRDHMRRCREGWAKIKSVLADKPHPTTSLLNMARYHRNRNMDKVAAWCRKYGYATPRDFQDAVDQPIEVE